MPQSETFCWMHMKDHCNHCELEQLRKIVKDAVYNIESADSFGDELDPDDLLKILKRPIKPSNIIEE
jgi:uncharacterized protein YnzC (UPF0291/DUF896 family)